MDALLATSLRALMKRSNWVRYRHMLDDEAFPNTQASTLYVLLRDMHEVSKTDIDERALRAARRYLCWRSPARDAASHQPCHGRG